MKNFKETRHALARLVIRLFGHKCENCGSRNTRHAHYWARGWNNLCNQAYGDYGALCFKCHHITWDKSDAEHRATIPIWCEPYNV